MNVIILRDDFCCLVNKIFLFWINEFSGKNQIAKSSKKSPEKQVCVISVLSFSLNMHDVCIILLYFYDLLVSS